MCCDVAINKMLYLATSIEHVGCEILSAIGDAEWRLVKELAEDVPQLFEL